MSTKLDKLSPDFFPLVQESILKGSFIEACCLTLQFFEHICWIVFLLESQQKHKFYSLGKEFKSEMSMVERNPSFLIFILFLNGVIGYEFYKSYTGLKQTRNRLVHNLVKKAKINYDREKLKVQLTKFLTECFVFIERIEIPKKDKA